MINTNDLMRYYLQAAVVAQDVQRRAVRLPQELEPGRHQLPIRAVLRVLTQLEEGALERNYQARDDTTTASNFPPVAESASEG